MSSFPLLAQPRAPTAAEVNELRNSFPNLGSNFLVIGEKTSEYNCLGWALNSKGSYTDDAYWLNNGLGENMQFQGLKEVDEASATIDLYYVGRQAVHVAKKHNNQWTSKLGNGLHIQHPRKALEGGIYGRAEKFYGPFATGTSSALATASHSIAMEPEHAEATEDDVSAVLEHAGMVTSLVAKKTVAPAPKKVTPAAAPKPAPAAPKKPVVPAAVAPKKPAATPAQPGKKPATTPAQPAKKPATTTPAKPATTTPAKPATTTPAKPAPATPAAKPAPAAGSPKFEAAYAAWKKTWTQPAIELASTAEAYRKSPEWKALIALGVAIVPQLVAKLTQPGNDAAVIAYQAIEPKLKAKKAPLAAQKAEIIKLNASRANKLKTGTATAALKTSEVLSSGLTGLGAVSELMKDPLFKEIIAEGSIATGHLLQMRAHNGTTGRELVEEMLKEIHEIEKKGGSLPEQKHDFKEWLADYVDTTAGPEAEAGPEAAEATQDVAVEGEETKAVAEDTEVASPAAQ